MKPGKVIYWVSNFNGESSDFKNLEIVRVLKKHSVIMAKTRLKTTSGKKPKIKYKTFFNFSKNMWEPEYTVIPWKKFKHLYLDKKDALQAERNLMKPFITKIDDSLYFMANLTLEGHFPGCLFHGPGGTGKSWIIEQAMKYYDIDFKSHKKGKLTMQALWNALFAHSKEGQVLILDDIKLEGEDSHNFLKAAMESRPVRHMTYESGNTSGLDATEFIMEGSVIVISNKRLDRSRNWQPILSRIQNIKVDPSRQMIMAKMEMISEVPSSDLSEKERKDSIEYIKENFNRFKTFDLRIWDKITGIRKLKFRFDEKRKDWRDMAMVSVVTNTTDFSFLESDV